MEKINRTSTIQAASISVFVSIILFLFIMIGAQAILPSYLFETSDFYVISILIEMIPLGIGAWLFLLLTKQKVSDVVKFSKPQAKMNRKNMPWLIVLGAVMAIVSRYFIVGIQLLWTYFLETVGYNVVESTYPAVDSLGVFVLALLGVAVTPAIFEELIFRGVMQKGLLRNTKPRTAILVSSLLFMLMHLSVESLPYTFICGLILGYMAYRCGSLIPSIAFHFVNNAIAVVILYAMELTNGFGIDMEAAADVAQYSFSENILIAIYAVISLGLLLLALWGFKKLSKAPPENPHMKPMDAKSIVFIVLSACILFTILVFFAILQNAVPV